MGYDGTLKFDTSIDSSGFQAGLSKLSGLASSAIKATTAVIGGAASAVAGIGAAAIKVGSDFEAGMSKVQSISGASATEIQQLAEKAKEMGAKTKFSATESAEDCTAHSDTSHCNTHCKTTFFSKPVCDHHTYWDQCRI